MRNLFFGLGLAAALCGCASSPPTPTLPSPGSASPSPSPSTQAGIVPPPMPATAPPVVTAPSSGAIQGVPSRRRETRVNLDIPSQPSGSSSGQLVDPSEVPPPYRSQKVYRFIENGEVILKTEQGIILSIEPLKS